MTDRVREYIYWLACVIAVVWLAVGVVDIAVWRQQATPKLQSN
jgi:hypothetical protein